MNSLHEREIAEWNRKPMIPGKIYQSLCVRELLDREELEYFYDISKWNSDIKELVDKYTCVVYLGSTVLEYTVSKQDNDKLFYGDSFQQTFIKILTEQGHCGWVIWFFGEWEEV